MLHFQTLRSQAIGYTAWRCSYNWELTWREPCDWLAFNTACVAKNDLKTQKHRNSQPPRLEKKVDTRSAYCYWKKRVPALNLSYAQRLIKTSADQIRKHTCKKVHNQETKTAFSTLATLNVRRPITHNANENRGQRYNKHLSMTVAAFRLQRNGVWEEQKNNCEACPYSKNN